MNRRLTATVAVCAVLALAGCGSDDAPTSLKDGAYAVGFDSPYKTDVTVDPGKYRTDGGAGCEYGLALLPLKPSQVVVSSGDMQSADGPTEVTLTKGAGTSSNQQGFLVRGPCTWTRVGD